MSGAPKIRAIEVIDSLEPVQRGFYAGVVAHVESDGSLDSCISIRCALKQGDIVTLQAGAGIVYDSVPEKEFEETEAKLGALARALGMEARNMIVIIDNYDSFTHNLYQYLRELTDEPVEVFRNDKITVDELAAMKPPGIVISPGPGRPEEAGISVEPIQRLAGHGAHPRGLPRPPGHRARVRRQDRAGTADRPRQGGRHAARRPGAVPRPARGRRSSRATIRWPSSGNLCPRSWR